MLVMVFFLYWYCEINDWVGEVCQIYIDTLSKYKQQFLYCVLSLRIPVLSGGVLELYFGFQVSYLDL